VYALCGSRKVASAKAMAPNWRAWGLCETMVTALWVEVSVQFSRSRHRTYETVRESHHKCEGHYENSEVRGPLKCIATRMNRRRPDERIIV